LAFELNSVVGDFKLADAVLDFEKEKFLGHGGAIKVYVDSHRFFDAWIFKNAALESDSPPTHLISNKSTHRRHLHNLQDPKCQRQVHGYQKHQQKDDDEKALLSPPVNNIRPISALIHNLLIALPRRLIVIRLNSWCCSFSHRFLSHLSDFVSETNKLIS
jgi:hypothetical protein